MTSLLKRPITETPNELTHDLDIADPLGFVRLLRQSDAQLFAGYLDLPSIYDNEILQTIQALVGVTSNVLNSKNGIIVMSGSGTSGRIAYLVSRTFNRLLRKLHLRPIFKYLISGGDKSIIMSLELPEDDPHLGCKDLKSLEAEAENIIYIAITCGLSAPYAMGQLFYTLENPRYAASVLIGFNPMQFARNAKVENWDQTAYSVAQKLNELAAKDSKRYFILNPAVGPEPVTGSTRMKGGSMTKILLETIFTQAIAALQPTIVHRPISSISLIQAYEQVYRETYIQAQPISEVLAHAADSLRANGHIYYVGSDSAGLMALIDASEMFDTYGEDYFTVRGFLSGGWKTAETAEGDLTNEGKLFHISIEEFCEEVLTTLTNNDLVIFPFLIMENGWSINSDPLVSLAKEIKNKGAKTSLIVVTDSNYRSESTTPVFDTCVFVPLSNASIINEVPTLLEFSLKLVINAISTGACVKKGRVFHNIMINLGISNNKLFYRSIGIVCRLMEATEETARCALLKAIHDVDEISDTINSYPISQHIEIATPKSMVLPLSMLLATGKFTVKAAKEALQKDPVIRNVIKDFISENKNNKS